MTKPRLVSLFLLSVVFLVGCPQTDKPVVPVDSQASSGSKQETPTDPGEPPADVAAASSDRSLVQTFRGMLWLAEASGETIDDASPMLEAVRRIDELGGSVGFDKEGVLTSVDLASGRIAAEDADLHHLAALPGLTELKLSGMITNAGVQHLAGLTRLVELTLTDTQISGEGLALLDALVELKSLNLQNSYALDDEGLARLSQFPKLTYLSLPDNSIITVDGLLRLDRLSELRLLDLRRCARVDTEAMKRLGRMPKLAGLKLGGWTITDDTMAVVAEMKSLNALAVEDCGLTDVGLKRLSGLDLEEFTLFRCYSVTNPGLVALADMKNLKRLSLRDTGVDAEGLAHIAGATAVVSLNLSDTAIDDTAMTTLASLVNLQRLELRQTQITDAAGETIGRLAQLTYLNLQDAGLSDLGVAHLTGLAELETLNLASNVDVTDASIDHLAKLAGLKVLNVGASGFTTDGVERLHDALPDCRVEWR